MAKCPHAKTVALYAQEREGGKRWFKRRARMCVACHATFAVEADKEAK